MSFGEILNPFYINFPKMFKLEAPLSFYLNSPFKAFISETQGKSFKHCFEFNNEMKGLA